MVCSNELPQLGDASAAIAGRFVPLLLTRSWLGEEDDTLEPALHEELPGILNWTLAGLERLTKDRRFVRPRDADEVLVALQDLASPVAAFVRDCCVRGPECQVPVDDLYGAYKTWADGNGHVKASKQVLGRDLRAVVPGLRRARPGQHEGDRPYHYFGVALKQSSKETASGTGDVDQDEVERLAAASLEAQRNGETC
jgi:putative DNA primase/helicase